MKRSVKPTRGQQVEEKEQEVCDRVVSNELSGVKLVSQQCTNNSNILPDVVLPTVIIYPDDQNGS